MCTKKLLAGLCATGILLSCGCASVRVKTDLKPEADPKLASSAGKFYIAELKYNYEDLDMATQPDFSQMEIKYAKNLLRLLRKECSARYPLLFSEDAESAVPLFVTVEDEFDLTLWKILVWELGTLTIVPMVLPGPLEAERNIKVSAGRWNGVDNEGSQTVRKEFHREETGWVTVLTPLGLISIPGESDLPKESDAFSGRPMAYDDTPQLAQQIATALAKNVATKDPGFWTAHPRSPVYPSALPVSSGAAPATLTLPTETVAPF